MTDLEAALARLMERHARVPRWVCGVRTAGPVDVGHSSGRREARVLRCTRAVDARGDHLLASASSGMKSVEALQQFHMDGACCWSMHMFTEQMVDRNRGGERHRPTDVSKCSCGLEAGDCDALAVAEALADDEPAAPDLEWGLEHPDGPVVEYPSRDAAESSSSGPWVVVSRTAAGPWKREPTLLDDGGGRDEEQR